MIVQIGQIAILLEVHIVHDGLERERRLKPNDNVLARLQTLAQELIDDDAILGVHFDVHPVRDQDENASLDEHMTRLAVHGLELGQQGLREPQVEVYVRDELPGRDACAVVRGVFEQDAAVDVRLVQLSWVVVGRE